MKHSVIITVIASLMLCLSLPTDAQRHRHHPGATTTTTKVDNKATQKADSANAIEAFSDTTSAVADVDTTSTPLIPTIWTTTIGMRASEIFLLN